jgi:hypothetical protein
MQRVEGKIEVRSDHLVSKFLEPKLRPMLAKSMYIVYTTCLPA